MAKKTTRPRAAAGKKKPAAGRKKTAPVKGKKTAPRKRPAPAPKKKKTGNFPWSILLAAVITFIVGIILVIVLGDKLKVQIPDAVTQKKPPIEKVTGKRRIALYFSSSDGKSLTSRSVKIGKGSAKAEATAIIKLLLKGPGKGSSLKSPIPEGTRLLSLRISNDRATIDFSKELWLNHPGGSSAELQTIYAIVNSITLNMAEVKTVRILISGKRRDTLAGHILIAVPLSADKKMISK